PLPSQIDEQKVIETIDPKKDVDGFHPINVGKMMQNKETFISCTPYGIMKMLKSKNIEISGKHAVVLGRSNIVGKPVGQLLYYFFQEQQRVFQIFQCFLILTFS